MVGNAIAHRFDEDRFAAVLERHSACFFCGFSDGEDVVAVNADSVDAVTDSSACDAVATILLQCGGGDGVAVVSTEENYGAGACGGNVESGMEVSFACSAFAEIAGNNSRSQVGVLKGLKFKSVGCPGGLGDLGREGRRDGMLIDC